MAQIKVSIGTPILVHACSHQACETGMVRTKLANCDSCHYSGWHSIITPGVDSRVRFVRYNCLR